MKEIRIEGRRCYKLDTGEIYPSVTTVLSVLADDSIQRWIDRVGESVAEYIRNQATTVGQKAHEMCEQYLATGEVKESDDIFANAHFYNLKWFLDKVDPIELEFPMWSHTLKMAGRSDCIGIVKKKLAIVDFKTSSKRKDVSMIKNYFMQGAAYAKMWEELKGEKVPMMYIAISGRDGSRDIFAEPTEKWLKPLQSIRNIYNDSFIESWRLTNEQKKNVKMS